MAFVTRQHYAFLSELTQGQDQGTGEHVSAVKLTWQLQDHKQNN